MADTAPAEETGVKTAQDVLGMSGADELKFGVLIGLIKVNQVTNKDVVDTVLNLVNITHFNMVANVKSMSVLVVVVVWDTVYTCL